MQEEEDEGGRAADAEAEAEAATAAAAAAAAASGRWRALFLEKRRATTQESSTAPSLFYDPSSDFDCDSDLIDR